jgi:L-asparaginase II
MKLFTDFGKAASHPVFRLLMIAALAIVGTLSARAQATVTTDKLDYIPGEYVIVTGSGWEPGETVDLDFHETPKVCTNDHHVRTTVADENGNIYYDQFLINDHHLGVHFVLTATGLSSGLVAVTEFDDGNTRFDASGLPNNTNVTVNYSFPGSGLGSSITFSTGPSGNGQSSPAIGVPNNSTFYFAYPTTVTVGSDVYILISTSHISPVSTTNAALNITGTYAIEGGSGGLTITAPECAQGGSFTITYTPASGNAVTQTLTTPFSVTAKKNTTYSITSVDGTVNGNTYTGSATVNGTTPNENDYEVTVTLTYVDDTAPVITTNGNQNVNNDAGLCSAEVEVSASATDNCGVGDPVGVRSDALPLTDPYPVGVTTITWNVTDVNGNPALEVEQTVTVTDDEAPTVVTQDVTIYLDADGNASTTASAVNDGSTDNCGIASLSLSKTDFTCDDVGENTVTLTVTDVNGNTATGTAVVTVLDNLPPTVNTQDITVYLDENGIAGIEPDEIDNASTDNCAIAAYALDIDSFDCDDVGTPVTVTLTVTDVNGNTATGTAVVTVLDNLPPTVNTQDITVYLDENGIAGIEPDEIDNASTDNCAIAAYALDIDSFDCDDVGTPVTVTLTVTDVNGNTATGTAVVTVLDNLPPTVNTQDITVYLDENGIAGIEPDEIDNASTDNCAIATYALDIDSFDCDDVGTPVTVTLTVTDVNGNTATGTAVVTVLDNLPPTVNTQDITVYLDENGIAGIEPDEIDNASTDNCAIAAYALDIDSFDCDDVGTPVTVTLTVTDVNGNTATGTAVVTVLDNLPPTVNTQDITVYLDENGIAGIEPDEIDNASTDNCAIAAYALDIDSFDCDDVGTPVTVTLTVTDVNGNTATGTAVVTVLDNLPPTVNTQDITVYLDENGIAGIEPDEIDNASTDNCAIATYALDIDSFDCDDVGTPVTVTLTVTDVNGNTATGTAVVTVLDNLPPTVNTQDITVYLDENGIAGIEPDEIDNASTDNCAIAAYALDIDSFDCDDVGTPVTVTLTVTDVNGNTATGTAVVTVLDNLPPTVNTQDITVYLDENGIAGIEPDEIDNASTDNCAIAAYALDIDSFDCDDVGTPVTVTLTVTDVNGNTATGTAVVTVLDELHRCLSLQHSGTNQHQCHLKCSDHACRSRGNGELLYR